MEAYKLWVRRNRDLVRSLESLANVIPPIPLPALLPSQSFSALLWSRELSPSSIQGMMCLLIDRGLCVSLGVR
jgi:hypothetical protein